MDTNDAFANVRIASPCLARWGHMVGDHRVRYCLQCQKHVYNFSAMTVEEIASVVREKEGRVCARFYRRADGTMLTADCPLGAGRFWRQVRVRIFASAALVTVAMAAVAGADTKPPEPTKAHGKLGLVWNDAKEKIKSLLGIKPQPTMLMGEICVAPPPTPAASQKPEVKN